MYPSLGLLSVEEEGWVHCWRVHPSRNAGQCWFKFNMAPSLRGLSNSKHGNSAFLDAVTSVKWWNHEIEVVTAVDAGRLHIWGLKSADLIDIHDIIETVAIEGETVHVGRKNQSKKSDRCRDKAASNCDECLVMNMVKSWRAHKDRICEMRLVKNALLFSSKTEPLILTSGFDCHTYIWAMMEERLGTFNQGVSINEDISERSSWWHLEIDTALDQKRQINEAENVLASLRDPSQKLERNTHGFQTAKRTLENLNFEGQEPTSKDLRTFLSSVLKRKPGATPEFPPNTKVQQYRPVSNRLCILKYFPLKLLQIDDGASTTAL